MSVGGEEKVKLCEGAVMAGDRCRRATWLWERCMVVAEWRKNSVGAVEGWRLVVESEFGG